MFGRKEVIQPATDTWSFISDVAAKFLPDEMFSSSQGTVREFPEENRLQEYQMTFSLSEVDLPTSIREWCRPGSRPGLRITKRRVDAQDHSRGWEAVVGRVAMLRGEVNEQIGDYERFIIDLTSGDTVMFSREQVAPQRGARALAAFQRLLSDCSPMWRLSLRDASFLERGSNDRYRLVP